MASKVEWTEEGTISKAVVTPGSSSHHVVFAAKGSRTIELHVPEEQLKMFIPTLLEDNEGYRLTIILEVSPKS